jgi:hypothetical protein
MTSSWKIGAASGLIAGIVGGIMAVINAISIINSGLSFFGTESLPIMPFTKITIIEITMYIIWGIILGIIYSKVYNLIPGKEISKGLIFCLIYWLVYPVRWICYNLMYGYYVWALGWVHHIIIFIPLGLALGISYEFLRKKYIVKKEEPAVLKYDLKNGIYPGAIAGLIQGICVFLSLLLFLNRALYPMIMADINVLLSQLGTHAFFNMIWGVVFGILFVRFFDRVPGKGISKGLIFGMITFFFTTFQTGIRGLVYLFYGSPDWGIAVILAGFVGFLPFGIVLGLLYRNPRD